MSIMIGNIQIKEGDKFKITKNGEYNGFGVCGETITIFRIYDGHTMGITCDRFNPSWGDLDGSVKSGHGYYINPEAFMSGNFERSGIQYMIANTFEYNGFDLKGKMCKMLYTQRNHDISFVEFEENIGGGGCDGLGKNGHCIAISSSLLSVILPKKTGKTNTKDKSNNDVNF